jgi:hypothetical protein
MFTPERPAYAEPLRAPGQLAQVAQVGGGRGGEPTSQHPTQSVSPLALAAAARAVGCRFPTEAEWKAAYQRFGGGGANANLRDAAFGAQKAHIAAMQANPAVVNKTAFQWPDAGTFGRDLDAAPPVDGAATVGNGNDGVLWFDPVNLGAGPVYHLAGNVAELICGDGPQMESTAADANALARVLDQSLSAIGGSALSDPGLGIDRANPIDLAFAEEGYADLGCRLAFSAKGVAPPRETFVARLSKIVTDDAFLFGNE